MSSASMQGLYQQVILDHARERHGFGLAASADTTSHQVNPTCGDEVTLQLTLDGGGGGGGDGSPRIRTLSWEGHGCAISQASASLLADLAPGLTAAELAQRIDVFRVAMRSKGTIEPDEELLGDAVVLGGTSKYVARVKCAMLAWVAAEEALLQL